jgi:hypothetical protein
MGQDSSSSLMNASGIGIIGIGTWNLSSWGILWLKHWS